MILLFLKGLGLLKNTLIWSAALEFVYKYFIYYTQLTCRMRDLDYLHQDFFLIICQASLWTAHNTSDTKEVLRLASKTLASVSKLFIAFYVLS